MFKFSKYSLAALTVLLVAGCTATPEPAPTTAPTTAPVERCEEDVMVSFPGLQYKETVEDEYGCYVRVEVAPEGTYGTVPDSLTGYQEAVAAGFTVEEINDAYDVAMNFFVSETLDSTALDNQNAVEDWIESEELTSFFTEETLNDLRATLEDSDLTSLGLVLAGVLPEPGKRDDVPRQDSVEVLPFEVVVDPEVPGQLTFVLQGEIIASYADAPFVQWVLRNNSNVTEEQFSSENPEFFNNEGLNAIKLTVESRLAVADGFIAGSNLYYETEIGSVEVEEEPVE